MRQIGLGKEEWLNIDEKLKKKNDAKTAKDQKMSTTKGKAKEKGASK